MTVESKPMDIKKAQVRIEHLNYAQGLLLKNCFGTTKIRIKLGNGIILGGNKFKKAKMVSKKGESR